MLQFHRGLSPLLGVLLPVCLSVCRFSARLLRDYHLGDAEAKYLMTAREFWVIPILNPDGYVAVEETGNREIRKNRRPWSSQLLSRAEEFGIDLGYRLENEGVDLNRNYGFHFHNQLPWVHTTYSVPAYRKTRRLRTYAHAH